MGYNEIKQFHDFPSLSANQVNFGFERESYDASEANTFLKVCIVLDQPEGLRFLEPGFLLEMILQPLTGGEFCLFTKGD